MSGSTSSGAVTVATILVSEGTLPHRLSPIFYIDPDAVADLTTLFYLHFAISEASCISSSAIKSLLDLCSISFVIG